jgi:hypothetical protein
MAADSPDNLPDRVRRDRASRFEQKETGAYNELAENVLQALRSPLLNPFVNQRLRWSELPWVNESGTT